MNLDDSADGIINKFEINFQKHLETLDNIL
jgi:hypothetical protein